MLIEPTMFKNVPYYFSHATRAFIGLSFSCFARLVAVVFNSERKPSVLFESGPWA